MDQTQELIDYLDDAAVHAMAAYARNREQGDEHQLYNLSSALNKNFQLGLMMWRKGAMPLAFEHFCRCLKAYSQKNSDADRFGGNAGFWEDFWEGNCREEAFPAAASYLIDGEFTFADPPSGVSRFEVEGYRPWYNSKLILSCMGHASFSRNELERSIELSKRNRSYPTPLIRLTEFHFEVLTGHWADRTSAEMLDQHSALYAGLKKIKGPPDLTHGEGGHNDRVVDWIFACILKRIGWSGRYMHAWPQDGEPPETGNVRQTLVEPHSFVEFM